MNVYNFSRPLNLIISYFLSFLLALPFLVIEAWALRTNGVAALDGSFVQLMTTSTGSKTLDNLAVGDCLGGSESVPEKLLGLRVGYEL